VAQRQKFLSNRLKADQYIAEVAIRSIGDTRKTD
jgi:hypothetical protein